MFQKKKKQQKNFALNFIFSQSSCQSEFHQASMGGDMKKQCLRQKTISLDFYLKQLLKHSKLKCHGTKYIAK